MVFYDWIQLFGAAQGSERRSQFGRLAYWLMVPAINMFYFNPCECLLKNLDSECLSPQAPVTIIQHSALLLHLLPSFLHLFSPAKNDFLTICAKATLSPHSESAMGYATPPQVGQPNRAIRKDIHHYPVGWSKWPWCSLHTQFQIPLGSIMGRFKQQERGRPSHLIPTILDVISAWCSAEKESNTVGWGVGMRWRGWVSRWWKRGRKLRWSKRASGDEKRRWLKMSGRAGS